MLTGHGRRALSFVYLGPYSAIAVGLILLGFAVDRAPLLPGSVTRRYQRAMLSVLVGLARPVDVLTERLSEPVAGGVTRESAP